MRSRRRPGLAVLALVGYDQLVRPWLRGWGATDRERRAPLPGDDLVRGRYQSTHAITIGASPAQVWPWIVQMGYGRGGWYSYDQLEQAIGAGDFAQAGSARSIVAGLQGLAVGDTVLLSANGGLTVVGLEVPHRLVLHYRMDLLTAAPASERSRAVFDWTWVFVLRPVGEGCRLIVRVRGDLAPSWLAVVVRPLLEPVHLVMERKTLLGLKQRAEQATTRAPAPLQHRSPEGGTGPAKGARTTWWGRNAAWLSS
jgi:hypothetical protein